MKLLVAAVCLLMIQLSYGKSWNKYYKLVNADIKSVEALKSRDLGLQVRLFELYGEKLSLLIERERDYRIQFLETGSNKRLNGLLKKQKKTLKKLDTLGNKIERIAKDKTVITKINYFRGLNYLSTKNDKKFFFYMKKAEKTNNDKKIGYNIHTKLANYYYNENNYKQASKYYKKLLYDKKSPWLTKHLYNLSWSELKQDRFKSALSYLKRAHFYDRKKGYFSIGDQLVDSLLLFHAYAQKTKSGLDYFKKFKVANFDNLLKYLHYVFGHGTRKDAEIVIKEIEKRKLTSKQEYQLLEKTVLVYRTMKRFSKLQRKLDAFKRKAIRFKEKKIDKITKEELVLAIKSYSGYLQELIKSSRLISEKNKEKYITYISNNFSVLKVIDRKNSLEYSFFEGETFFSLEKYNIATAVYIKGLKKFKKTGRRKNEYLKKVFDSVFKSLENDPKTKKPSLLFVFNTYIYFYPRGKKTNEIYQRILALHKSSGDEKRMFTTLRRYNKAFPKMLKVQKDFYKQVLNSYIDKKDIAALMKLQKLVSKRFLGFTPKESRTIGKIIKQIKFSRFEELAKAGKFNEAIDGFYRLFNDKKGKYSLRIDALRKVMFFQNKIYSYIDLSKTIGTARNFMKKKDKKTHHDELMFYGQNICYGDYQKSCLSVLKTLKSDKAFKLTESLENFYFKLRTLYSEDLNNDFRIAKTDSNKNFVFKVLLLKEGDFSSKLFRNFYRMPKMKAVIEGEVERKVLNVFYNTLNLNKTKSYVKSIGVKQLRNRYIEQLEKIQNISGSINFKLPATPKAKIITEQIFVNFGQAVENGASQIFQNIQNIINQTDPNYLPFVLSKVVTRFEKEVAKFKKFIPVSKNADFEAAMSDAVTNFHRIFDGKIIEYRSLYFRTLQNTIKGSGVKKYGSDIMTKPKTNSYGHVTLWQN